MKKIIVFYKYFRPARNAGGIVRSLDSLVSLLSKDFEFYIFTSAYDLGVSKQLPGLIVDEWVVYSPNTKVYYCTLRYNHYGLLKRIFTNTRFDVVYINGFFSPPFILYPLFITGRLSHKPIVVVAPRGMLQTGALKVKPLKKIVYLALFRLLRFHENVRWHATDDQEVKDIQVQFGVRSNVVLAILALDTPASKIPEVRILPKEVGSARLVFLSLVTEKKNLLFLIQSLRSIPGDYKITLDVYGPIKDASYWHTCLEESKKLPVNVSFFYGGAVHPDEVIEKLQSYHFFILPTLGENFGHAIYESLLAGKPVIISSLTPWRDLEASLAGWDFDLSERNLQHFVGKAADMDQVTYAKFCFGAQKLALGYLRDNDFRQQYNNLFAS